MNERFILTNISPVDGRYYDKTRELRDYFSEYALIKYRVFVEIKYLLALHSLGIPPLNELTPSDIESIDMIQKSFNINDAEKIKAIEKKTNHDVKAVEYFIKEKIRNIGLSKYIEFVHFGLTSQDINNTVFPMMINDAMTEVIMPRLLDLKDILSRYAREWKDVPLLARTHGQPASPTTLGKEIYVFVERLQKQIDKWNETTVTAKFGGATGNFNAHIAAFPQYDWRRFADNFVRQALGLEREQYTTQISHYDSLAEVFHLMSRINTILIDLAQDIWLYISLDYFKQKILPGEVGSSAMPHKVNPIDFENAEGNLKTANALFGFLAAKLPVSRLQRDLTDSTVIRNAGVPFAHTLIALKSLQKGWGKLLLNKEKIDKDLDDNWVVISEAIQNILRSISYPEPYEALKKLTRSNEKITKQKLHEFIDSLDVTPGIKERLKAISPFTYTGYKLE